MKGVRLKKPMLMLNIKGSDRGQGRKANDRGQGRKENEAQLIRFLDLDFQTEKSEFDNEAFRKLITNEPNLVKKKYQFKCHEKKMYPIVMALLHNASEDIVCDMQKTCPKATESCPLSALLMKEKVEVIQNALLGNSQAITNTYGGLNFLHLVFIFSGNFETIKFLLDEVNPKWMMKKDLFGNTPLSLACKGPFDLEVIKLLVDRSPRTVDICNKNGMTPLHLLCKKEEPSLETVKYLVGCCPASLVMCDKSGNSPLHGACSINISSEVITFLARQLPHLLIKKNENGDIPYSLAADNLTRPIHPSDLFSLRKGSFHKQLLEDDVGIIAKMDTLVPLIFSASALATFHNLVCAKYRIGEISEIEQSRLIFASLTVASKLANSERSAKTIEIFLNKAVKKKLISDTARRSFGRNTRSSLLRRSERRVSSEMVSSRGSRNLELTIPYESFSFL